MQIKSLVVGLGKIGMGYDYFETKKIHSHANALDIHSSYSLSGGVDSNVFKRNNFYKKYQAETFKSYLNAIKKINPELVVISTPINTHYRILKKIVKIKNIKAILCEKPITDSIDKTKEIYKLFTNTRKFFFINYVRQYDPIINKILKIIKKDVSNSTAKINVKYYNGFYNNASHFIFLIGKIFGFSDKISILSAKRKNPIIDSRVDFEIKYKKATAKFFSVNEEKQKIKNEIDIITPKKKVSFSSRSGKIFIYNNKGRKKILNTQMNISQYNVFDNISRYLKKKEKILCNPKDALKVEIILNKILKNI